MKCLRNTIPLTLALSPKGRGDKARSKPLFLAHFLKWRGDKAGYLLLEMIVAMILLGTAMSIVIPTLGWMGVQSRVSLQRQAAIQGLDSLMDELTTRPYAELTPEAAGKIKLPEALETQLSGAKLKVEITQTKDSSKRIQARLTWNQRNGSPLAPLRVTAWAHEREALP